MNKIETILRCYNASFIYKDHAFEILNVDGRIYWDNDFIYFLHGNREVEIPYNDPKLNEYIDKYLLGFDEFEEFVRDNLGTKYAEGV